MTRRLSKLTVAAGLILLGRVASAQAPVVEAAREPITWIKPVQDKNFYLLSLFERTPNVKSALLADPALASLADTKRRALSGSVNSCEPKAACYAAALRFTDAEVAKAADTLAALYRTNAALRSMVDGPLRSSGMFQRYHSMSGEAMLVRAWKDAAAGMNNLIDVYGTGAKPRYPEIDSITYDPASQNYVRLLRIIVSTMADDTSTLDLFFEVPLQFALHVTDANHRDEAGRFEPMHLGENAAAFQHIPDIQWTRYRYSAIVVPGAGNDRSGVALSPWGKMRLTLAAHRYHSGLAPLVIVSGGFVHPNQTPYAEAIEMKRSLIRDFGVPEQAILVDPHARHTTTNLRNAVRLMYRYGVPIDKTALITTDLYQSEYIESAVFTERCDKELGYQPHQILRRTSPSDLEFLPKIESLQADAADPLDP